MAETNFYKLIFQNPKGKSRVDHQNWLDPAENKRVCDELFERIKVDPELWRKFM